MLNFRFFFSKNWFSCVCLKGRWPFYLFCSPLCSEHLKYRIFDFYFKARFSPMFISFIKIISQRFTCLLLIIPERKRSQWWLRQWKKWRQNLFWCVHPYEAERTHLLTISRVAWNPVLKKFLVHLFLVIGKTSPWMMVMWSSDSCHI